jgi:hypothetical protein
MAAPDQLGTYWFRSAEAADAASVAELVDAAYGHYVERIGMLPGPMTEDYAEVIRNRQVTVAERHGAIVGVRRVRPALPRSVLTCLPAQAPWMSLPLGPLGPPRGGQDPGPQRRGRQQEITLDRRVAGASRPSSSCAGTCAPTR